jgi:hypothetical protein
MLWGQGPHVTWILLLFQILKSIRRAQAGGWTAVLLSTKEQLNEAQDITHERNFEAKVSYKFNACGHLGHIT